MYFTTNFILSKNPTEVEINYFKTSVIEYLDKVKNKKY